MNTIMGFSQYISAYILPVFLSILGMGMIMAVRYFVTSGGFALLSQMVHPGIYHGQKKQIQAEIFHSLMATIVFAIPAGLVAWGWHNHGWTMIYTDISAMPLWYLPLSLCLYLFAHDTWFYWTHRAMHIPRLFRIMHMVHHQSRPPTAWAAMSFNISEAVTGAIVIPLLVFFIPIHIGVLGLVLMIMTIMGITNHMGWELFPHWLVRGGAGKFLITASHHHKHHQNYLCNYGLYFRFWDRLCGTDKGLEDFTKR